MIRIDAFTDEYMEVCMLISEMLNKGEKATVFKLQNEVYKVFNAPKSSEYIKNQGGMEKFEGKIISLSDLPMDYIAKPTRIIYKENSSSKNDVFAYVSEYIGDEYKPGSKNYEDTIALYADLTKKQKELSENGIVMPDGFNFGNYRIQKDGTLGFTDLDGMQLNGIFTTQSISDFLLKFISANKGDYEVVNSYFNDINGIYTEDVNVFNSIGLFLYDMINIDITKYNKRYLDYLIKDIGIRNDSINEKIRRLFSRDEKEFFTDEDYLDLKEHYKVVDNYTNSVTGNTKRFELK